MPTYQYQCEECSHTFETFQSMLDKKLKKCPQCGRHTLNRLIGSGAGIIFKGSGFYATDYRKKDGAANSSKGKAENKPVDAAKDGDKTCPLSNQPKCKGCSEEAG